MTLFQITVVFCALFVFEQSLLNLLRTDTLRYVVQKLSHIEVFGLMLLNLLATLLFPILESEFLIVFLGSFLGLFLGVVICALIKLGRYRIPRSEWQ